MHPLIDRAKDAISSWSNGDASILMHQVASICRSTLDEGGLPSSSPDWAKLRLAFVIPDVPDISSTVIDWDNQCRTGDFKLLDDKIAFIKIGIVTWLVKFLLKQLGLLIGSAPIPEFVEWKSRLCECLDKYILVQRIV